MAQLGKNMYKTLWVGIFKKEVIFMAITYEDVNPTLIPNTTMQKMLSNGAHRTYIITPIEGYVLRDKENDAPMIDEITGEIIGTKFCYASMGASCGASYDFTPVQVTDENGVTHTAYGSREFFARPESEVPADQIFGGGEDNNDHEIM